MIRTLGCPELPDPPICLRVGILHSRAVGIDVEVHLCSCFREAQHCGYFVCSLGGFLDAAAGMDTKPAPVRGSGSPQASRLISARAGKTSGAAPRNHRGTAHPGVCGENSTIVGMASAKPGSSPRVRRKRPGGVVGVQHPGLIPACAGKTRLCSTSCPEPRAHPRACGENARILSRTQWTRGSSPRVRGKQRHGRGGRWLLRLIPARAGKTH